MQNQQVSIHLIEITGIDRINEPIAIGVPFAQGFLVADENLCLVGEDGETASAQFSINAQGKVRLPSPVMEDFFLVAQ